MNIAAGDNCVLMVVISQKFALLTHFCIADVVFLLRRYNYRRANGGEQFTGSKCNWSAGSKRDETSRTGERGKNKIWATKKKKKEGKEEGEKIYCTENILHTYVYINSFLIPVRPITFAGVA